MKKMNVKKHHLHLSSKLKKALNFGVTAFCIANNGAYFLTQRELVKCLSRDIYYFSKSHARKIRIFPKKHMIKHMIKSDLVKGVPKDIAHLLRKLS